MVMEMEEEDHSESSSNNTSSPYAGGLIEPPNFYSYAHLVPLGRPFNDYRDIVIYERYKHGLANCK